jgi:hypothetical protein
MCTRSKGIGESVVEEGSVSSKSVVELIDHVEEGGVDGYEYEVCASVEEITNYHTLLHE